MPPKPPKTLSDRLSELQNKYDMSFADIAARTGLSRSYVGMIVTGRRPSVDPSLTLAGILERLARAFPELEDEFVCQCCGAPSLTQVTHVVTEEADS